MGARCSRCRKPHESGKRKTCQACRDRDAVRNPQKREAARQMIIKAKSKPCFCCGKSFPPSAMDLHHVDRKNKSFRLGALRDYRVSFDRAKEELDKCLPLCACCHRVLETWIENRASGSDELKSYCDTYDIDPMRFAEATADKAARKRLRRACKVCS